MLSTFQINKESPFAYIPEEITKHILEYTGNFQLIASRACRLFRELSRDSQYTKTCIKCVNVEEPSPSGNFRRRIRVSSVLSNLAIQNWAFDNGLLDARERDLGNFLTNISFAGSTDVLKSTISYLMGEEKKKSNLLPLLVRIVSSRRYDMFMTFYQETKDYLLEYGNTQEKETSFYLIETLVKAYLYVSCDEARKILTLEEAITIRDKLLEVFSGRSRELDIAIMIGTGTLELKRNSKLINEHILDACVDHADKSLSSIVHSIAGNKLNLLVSYVSSKKDLGILCGYIERTLDVRYKELFTYVEITENVKLQVMESIFNSCCVTLLEDISKEWNDWKTLIYNSPKPFLLLVLTESGDGDFFYHSTRRGMGLTRSSPKFIKFLYDNSNEEERVMLADYEFNVDINYFNGDFYELFDVVMEIYEFCEEHNLPRLGKSALRHYLNNLFDDSACSVEMYNFMVSLGCSSDEQDLLYFQDELADVQGTDCRYEDQEALELLVANLKTKLGK